MPIRRFICGTHMSFPSLPNKVGTETVWAIAFHKSLLYRFGDKEWDWGIRKAAGVKEKFFSPQFRAAMIGFRPDQESFTTIEVFPYFDINKADHFPMPAPLTVSFDEGKEWTDVIYCKLVIDSPIFTWEVYDKDKSLLFVYPFDLQTNATRLWEIDPWFGGKAKAKCDMRIFVEKTKL